MLAMYAGPTPLLPPLAPDLHKSDRQSTAGIAAGFTPTPQKLWQGITPFSGQRNLIGSIRIIRKTVSFLQLNEDVRP